MTAFSRQGIWLLLIACQAMGSGCALNSFQATIIPTPPTVTPGSRVLGCDKNTGSQQLKVLSSANETSPTRQPVKTFVLIHGIYGDEKTFGELPFLLACDYKGSSVYTTKYWSSQWLPNFQRLKDLGREFQYFLEKIHDFEKNCQRLCETPPSVII